MIVHHRAQKSFRWLVKEDLFYRYIRYIKTGLAQHIIVRQEPSGSTEDTAAGRAAEKYRKKDKKPIFSKGQKVKCHCAIAGKL